MIILYIYVIFGIPGFGVKNWFFEYSKYSVFIPYFDFIQFWRKIQNTEYGKMCLKFSKVQNSENSVFRRALAKYKSLFQVLGEVGVCLCV